MKKFGKLVLSTAVLGAAVYGVYSYLNKLEEEEDYGYDDSDYEEVDENGEPVASAEEEEFYDDEVDTAETIKQAANRAYTTIQHGSKKAMEKVKEAVGPRGEEVISEVGVAAREVGKTVKDSASKICEILKEKDEIAEDDFDETEGDFVVEIEKAETAEPAETAAESAETAETVKSVEEAQVPVEETSVEETSEAPACDVAAAEPAVETAPAASQAAPENSRAMDSYVRLQNAAAQATEAAKQKAEDLQDAADSQKVESFFDDGAEA